MKISSASKKVLASALSAAMVVAFAPTVAFGATATTTAVSITRDFNNGKTTSVTSAGMLQYGNDGKYYIVAPDDPSGVFSEGDSGYAFDKWFIDADGDGLLDEGEKTKDTTSNLIEVPAGTTAVTLKAAYKAPDVTGVVYSSGDLAFTVNLNGNSATGVSGHDYKLTVANSDGAELGSVVLSSGAITGSTLDKTVKFGTGADINILPGLQTSGKYTFTLTDTKADTKAVKAVSSKKFELAKVTIDNEAPKFIAAETTGNYQLPGTAGVYYYDAAGNYIGKGTDTVTVKGDVTFKTSTTAKPTVKDVEYTAANNKQLSFDVEAVTDAVKYVAKVDGPGFSKEFTYKTAADNISEAITEAAGTWTVAVTAYDKTGYQLATGKATMVLTEVKYDVAGGTLVAKDPSNTVVKKDYFTTDTTASTANDNVKANPAEGYAFDKWVLNGKEFKDGDKVVAGQVNTITATYTEIKAAAAPEYSVAKASVGGVDHYALSVTPAAGTTVAVSGSTSGTINKATDGTYIVTGNATVTITAKAAGVADKVITLNKTYGSDWANLLNWNIATKGGTSALSLAIGNGTAKWNAVEAIAAAVTAGDTAIAGIQGKYYASTKDINASDLASYKALYEAVAAEAAAQVAAYADGAYVVAGDTAYVMTQTQYDAAKKKVADATHAVDLALVDATTDNKITAYKAGITNVVNAANAALKTAGKAPVTKADIEAAAGVTAQLKAAKTSAEAEAALKAYEALTTAQKALVATADVAAAEAVIAKQAVKDAQDDAAVSKARDASKTVKAGKNGKTAKKQSVTLKKITSKSGAKVTYKKSSGSSKVTVKSGKAYLAKGVKKGTYKATVKATCGTQTAKIKVTFKVK